MMHRNAHAHNLDPWPNGLESWCKSTQVSKTRTCIQIAMGGQTDLQVSWQVHTCHTFYAYIQMPCDQLVLTCIWTWAWPKSTQVHASAWPNETQVAYKSKTCIDLCQLVSPFDQGFSFYFSNIYHFPFYLILKYVHILFEVSRCREVGLESVQAPTHWWQ